MSKRVERIAGAIVVDGQQVAETLQCCHCGQHWERRPGSGTLRGYCMKCNSVLCGQPACMKNCKPFEKWLEEVEKADKVNLESLERVADLVIARK